MGSFHPLSWSWRGKIVSFDDTPTCTIVSGTSGKTAAHFIPYIARFYVEENLLCTIIFSALTFARMFLMQVRQVDRWEVNIFPMIELDYVDLIYGQLLLTFLGKTEFRRSSFLATPVHVKMSILMWPSCLRLM